MAWDTMVLALTTICAGLFTGIIVAMASVIQGVLNTLTAPEYTRVMQEIITQGRKSRIILLLLLLPILITLPLLVFFYAQAKTSAFGFTFAGTVTWITGPFLISRWLNEPLYDVIMLWAIQTPPQDWQRYRVRWFYLNKLRASSALIAFILFGVAVHLSLL